MKVYVETALSDSYPRIKGIRSRANFIRNIVSRYLAVPYDLALLAEAYSMLGEPETGLGVLTEALALEDTTGERWYESECYRLKGELLLQQNPDNQAEAEACFHHALEIARSQQAKSFELNAWCELTTDGYTEGAPSR